MKGIVVTFELVGAKFQMASIFMRSGRFVQSVTESAASRRSTQAT